MLNNYNANKLSEVYQQGYEEQIKGYNELIEDVSNQLEEKNDNISELEVQIRTTKRSQRSLG